MSGFYAKVILDSVSTLGHRLVTVEARYPRFVHSELMTHRMFSRNAASSRAIPIEKMIRMVEEDPAVPVWWGKNQSGMQALEELDEHGKRYAVAGWLTARDNAVELAKRMSKDGLHKQIVNRILEPWCWITTIISATEWNNFFKLRCHPDAQPELRHVAELIRDAIGASTPTERLWHMPYVSQEERWTPGVSWRDVSVARCARVSYLTHDGKREPGKDIELYDRLKISGHWSPFEHVACALGADDGLSTSNFTGWQQYRKDFKGESGRA